MQVDSLRAQQGLHTFTGSARGSFFNSLGLFVMGGSSCGVLMNFNGSWVLLPAAITLITCSADQKVDSTNICIKKRQRRRHGRKCVDSTIFGNHDPGLGDLHRSTTTAATTGGHAATTMPTK
mmetsp:Transcript_74654/g.150206  ORF Transcript_74654/g.150206 Transcript_74654/m.150206 type:complete len:122 (+) Transcript_74654:52-417(+)